VNENIIFAVVMNELTSILAFSNTHNLDYYNYFVIVEEKPVIQSG